MTLASQAKKKRGTGSPSAGRSAKTARPADRQPPVAAQEAHEPAVSCVDVWEAASWMRPKSSSIPAGCDKTRKLLQHCRALAEWRERRFSLGDQSAEPLLRSINAEQGNERGLAAPCVLGHSLAEGLGVALRIEQVVGELKGLAES